MMRRCYIELEASLNIMKPTFFYIYIEKLKLEMRSDRSKRVILLQIINTYICSFEFENILLFTFLYNALPSYV